MRAKRTNQSQVARATTAILLAIIILMVAHQYTSADHTPEEPPDGQPLPEPAHIIGNYTLDQEQHDLTTHHAQPRTQDLRIWSSPQSESLRLETDYLSQQLGPWSTNTPFTINENGAIETDQPDLLVKRLELGPEPVFTSGSTDTIQFSQRPMWVHLTTHEDNLTLHLDDGDATGQDVYVSKKLLHAHDMHRPIAHHEDGTPLNVTPAENQTGFWIEVPHFSGIVLSPADIDVKGRQAGLTFPHQGEITWHPTTNDLYINVSQKAATYELLVEKAWFEAKMPHPALIDHAWELELHDHAWYYVSTLEPQDTPTRVHYQEFRATPDPVYTFGSPSTLQANPFNATLQEERGPMWVQIHENATSIDVDLEPADPGPYDVLVANEWLDEVLLEHPVFTVDDEPLPVEPLFGGDWLFSFVDDINARIFDSQNGTLIPPRYERVPGGLVKHLDGCGIHHLVSVDEGNIIHEGPGCLNATSLNQLATKSTNATWLHGANAFTTCAVYHEESPTETSFIGAPCDGLDPLGSLPGFVEDLCTSASWGDKSHEAFCESGLTRYQAAGLGLDVGLEAGAVLRDVLYYHDLIMDWENTVNANTTLQVMQEWQDAAAFFFDYIQWQEPCLDGRASLLFTPMAPRTICQRAINEYESESESGSVVLEMEDVQTEWSLLHEQTPCVERETIVVLDGFQEAYCGELFPLIRDAADGFMGEVDWQACSDDRGFLGLGLGENGTSASVCGIDVGYPGDPETAASWETVRGLEACSKEVSFVLDPDGGVPDWLCEKALTSAQQNDVAEVFSYIDNERPCGVNGAPLLVVGGAYDAPVVVCGEVVSGLGAEWEEDWGYVAASNPCMGETVLVSVNHSMGRLCAQDYSVNQTRWENVVDGVTENYCLGAGEQAFLAITSDPVVVCGEVLLDDAGTWAYWESVAGALNPCGSQVIWVPGNQSLELEADGRLCGVSVPDFGGLVDDLRAWDDLQGLCPVWKTAVVVPTGETAACGRGLDWEPSLSTVLQELSGSSPCGANEHFLVGFGEPAFALCGEQFDDQQLFLALLQKSLPDNRPCLMEAPLGSEVCGLDLTAAQAACGQLLCVDHMSWTGNKTSPLGYPVVANETVLWFVGAQGIALDCETPVVGCALEESGLHGVMAAYAGSQAEAESWRVRSGGADVLDSQSAVHAFPWRVWSDNLLSGLDPWLFQEPDAGFFDPVWKPWSQLAEVDPLDVPERTAQLYGYELPENQCAGPVPVLEDALDELGVALERNMTPVGSVVSQLSSQEEDALAGVIGCMAVHAPRIIEEAPGLAEAYAGNVSFGVEAWEMLQSGELESGPSADTLASLRDLLSVLRELPGYESVPMSGSPFCVDPDCLIRLGGAGDDVYVDDTLLIMDSGGNDTYENNAAGANALLSEYTDDDGFPVSTLVDQGEGNDHYVPVSSDGAIRHVVGDFEDPQPYVFSPYSTIGSGSYGGVGILVDDGGDDYFGGLGDTMGSGFGGGAGFLLSRDGNDVFESTWSLNHTGSTPGESSKSLMGASQNAGSGFLINEEGNDLYTQNGVDSMGWGGPSGFGLLLDLDGNDKYTVNPGLFSGGVDDTGTGVSLGLGERGGRGVLLDRTGHDEYSCTGQVTYGCMGSSVQGALGALIDREGNDQYSIPPPGDWLFHEGMGAASMGGIGMFVEREGDDMYRSEAPFTGGFANHGGLGVFLDLQNQDLYDFDYPSTVGERRDDSAWIGIRPLCDEPIFIAPGTSDPCPTLPDLPDELTESLYSGVGLGIDILSGG